MTIDLHVIYLPQFVANAEQLFDALKTGVAWDERMRARKTASFGQPYNYSGIFYEATPMHPLLHPILDDFNERFGFLPNNCLLNLYESGTSTMGFHTDSSADLVPDTGVAILSLGSRRTLVFRAKRNKTLAHAFALESGSLVYMAPDVQVAWKHALPAQPGAGPRISLTFRRLSVNKGASSPPPD